MPAPSGSPGLGLPDRFHLAWVLEDGEAVAAGTALAPVLALLEA